MFTFAGAPGMAGNSNHRPVRNSKKYFSVKEVIQELNADSDSDIEASSDNSKSSSDDKNQSNSESESESDDGDNSTPQIPAHTGMNCMLLY